MSESFTYQFFAASKFQGKNLIATNTHFGARENTHRNTNVSVCSEARPKVGLHINKQEKTFEFELKFISQNLKFERDARVR